MVRFSPSAHRNDLKGLEVPVQEKKKYQYHGRMVVKRGKMQWKDKIAHPDRVLEHINPGMSIFLGTVMAEPKTLVKHLMDSQAGNLQAFLSVFR